MPPDMGCPDIPLRWLENARADLALARVTLPPGARYEHLCFHAQQAVEKGLKAVLLKRGVEFPFTHNLQGLLDRMPPELNVPRGVLDAVVLTPYAVTARYPGEFEPVSETDRQDAVRLAEVALQWAHDVVLDR